MVSRGTSRRFGWLSPGRPSDFQRQQFYLALAAREQTGGSQARARLFLEAARHLSSANEHQQARHEVAP